MRVGNKTTFNIEELTEALSNNWTNSLTGRVAGLNLLKSGGGPSGSNKIVLRGENSLAGNSEALHSQVWALRTGISMHVEAS